MTTRLVLVDDHELVRAAVRTLFQQDSAFCVVGEAADGPTAVALVADCRPDVVVMDVSLPGLSGIEATRQVLQQAPQVKVVALSMYDDPQYVAGMLNAGAAGYVLKAAAAAEVPQAVRAVCAGSTYLSPQVAGAVYDQVHALARHPELKERERQVLRWISEGLSTPEIARKMNLSEHTVHTHRQHIMDKLDRHSVAALTKYAIRTGLTTL